MQSLLLPAPWFSKTHFGPHRFDIDPGSVSVHLWPPSSTGPKTNLKTSCSPPPMSGIVPTGTEAPPSAYNNTSTNQREQQIGGRSDLTASADQNRSDLPPKLPTLIPIEGSGAASTQLARFLTTEELLVNSTTQVPSINPALSLSRMVSGSPQLGLHGVQTSSAIRALPPRSTRRAKAHVASACVNCKKKHLGCDSARPCRRCVLSGKASTCVDVTHKKRGRPPLKAEESHSRAVPPLNSSATPLEQYQTGSSARGPGHQKTSSREIRPVTDLQYSRPLEYGPTGIGSSISPLAASSGRWQPLTSPQAFTAGYNQRPVSSAGPSPVSSIHYTHTNPYTSYQMTAFPPPPGAPDMPSVPHYNDRPPTTTPPTVSPQQYQQNFPPTLQSHISPQIHNRGLEITPDPSAFGFREPHNDPGVRLPPILPSHPTYPAHTSAHFHRRSGSFPNQFSYQTLNIDPQQPLQEPPMSSLSSQHISRQQDSPRSLVELQSPYPPVSGAVSGFQERSAPYIHQSQTTYGMANPPTSAATASPVYNERRRRSPADESEENPQPVKRRRMALDDIVND